MKLFAKISDPGLLLKSLNERGTAFYHIVKDNTVEAVYFSASRTIYFIGDLTPQQYDSLKGQAYPAERISFNEQLGTIEVSQLEDKA